MSREIKFRAWDGFNLVYPDSRGWFNGVTIIIGEPHRQDIRLDTAIRQLSAMQFTGLKDKNGKEIYEGDIVKYKTSEQGKEHNFFYEQKRVSFFNGSFGFQEWYCPENKLTDRKYVVPASFKNLYYQNFDAEVIGNIYQNPELLNNNSPTNE